MENKCYNCHYEAEWKEHYIMAVKRFDKAMRTALTVTMVSVIIMLICTIIAAYLGMKVIQFINSFEYVEETTYSIEQDDQGINTAIIGGEGNEVKINNGTEDH